LIRINITLQMFSVVKDVTMCVGQVASVSDDCSACIVWVSAGYALLDENTTSLQDIDSYSPRTQCHIPAH